MNSNKPLLLTCDFNSVVPTSPRIVGFIPSEVIVSKDAEVQRQIDARRAAREQQHAAYWMRYTSFKRRWDNDPWDESIDRE